MDLVDYIIIGFTVLLYLFILYSPSDTLSSIFLVILLILVLLFDKWSDKNDK